MNFDFTNARTRLGEEYKSISGLKIDLEWSVWFELYREVFCEKLDSLGFTNEADFVALLVRMDEYNNIGEFLIDQEKQQAEMAAYGLVVFDRILRSEAANVSHFAVFCMHQELHECYGFALREFYEYGVNLNRKVALTTAGRAGGNAKAARFEKLKEWILREAAGSHKPDKELARELSNKLPEHLFGISKEPERYIYEVIRKSKELN